MDPDAFGADELFATLDRMGEAQVERLLEAGEWGPRQQPFVREWLLRRAEERARRQAESDPG